MVFKKKKKMSTSSNSTFQISDVCTGRECFERNTCARNGGICQCSSGLDFDGEKSKCIGMKIINLNTELQNFRMITHFVNCELHLGVRCQ